MEQQDLRTTIIQLENNLSDADRQRFHFLLADHAPRHWVECPNITGTFNLIQSLFDQDKINDQNFTFLINAFHKIGCQRAVELLKGLKIQMQPKGSTSSSTTTSLTDEVVEDQIDTPDAQSCLLKECLCDDFLKNDYKKDPSVKINLNPTEIISSASEQSSSFYCIPSNIDKKFIFIFLLLLLVSGTLIGSFYMNKLSGQAIKTDNTCKESQQIDTTSAPMKESSTELSAQMVYETSLKIFGPIYGSAAKDADSFNHSSMNGFTYFHSLSGIIFRKNSDDSESYAFIYSPIHDRQYSIETKPYGPQKVLTNRNKMELQGTDWIEKVVVQFIEESSAPSDDTSGITSKLVGIEFETRNGHIFESSNKREGSKTYSEEHQGYTLGYIVGSATKDYINQIRFVWYKTG